MAIKKINKGVYYYQGKVIKENEIAGLDYANAYKGTIAYGILAKHNVNGTTQKDGKLNI